MPKGTGGWPVHFIFAVRLCHLLRRTPRQQRHQHQPPDHHRKTISTAGKWQGWPVSSMRIAPKSASILFTPALRMKPRS